MTEHNTTLTIDLSEEYKIKIEKPRDLKQSFFKDIYHQAAKAVDDIIEQAPKYDPTNNKEVDPDDPFLNEKQDYNNIIAFCGERGTGKSSAMITFAQSLLKIQDKECKNFYEHRALLKTEFKTIQVVDPSLFEKHENIFEVILAQLFSSFEKELIKKDRDRDLDDKRQLLEQFEKVYENLQTIKKNGETYDGEALETLSKLACGANLRQNFKELVKRYLNFIVDDGNSDNSYLIIPIDDFDLNVDAVAEMAEQIRKYLMIPQVIVLMAVKIEQLSEAKEQQVRKDFRTLIDSNSINEDPRKITHQYVLKLIPVSKRLSLPRLSVSAKNTQFRIIRALGDKEDVVEGTDIESCILSAINQKLGLIFITKENENHVLIPTELRKLRELVKLLFDRNESSQIELINLFEDFLFSNTFPEKISQNYMELLEKLRSVDYLRKNKFLIDSIVDMLSKDYIKNNKREAVQTKEAVKFSNMGQGIEHLISKKNQSINVVLADVLYFLNNMRDYYNNFEISAFVEAAKVYYSILLYRLIVINKEYAKGQLIFGDSPLTDFQEDKKLVPKSRHEQKFPITDDLNSLLKQLPKQELSHIEELNFFISYYGDIAKRELRSNSYYNQDVVINNNIQNYRSFQFNLFSFIGLAIYPNSVYERFGEYSKSFPDNSYDSNVVEWHEKYNLVFPVYSVELLEAVFKKDFSRLDFSGAGVLKQFQILLEEILKRLEKSLPDVRERQKILDAYKTSPFYSLFINEEVGSSLTHILVTDINDEISGRSVPQKTGLFLLKNLVWGASHKTAETLGRAIKEWANPVLNEDENRELENLIAEYCSTSNETSPLKTRISQFIDEKSN